MGVDGPRGRAAVRGGRLNPFRSWLRLLGIAAEPVSFTVPEPRAAVLDRLLDSSTPELEVEPWLDGVRVTLAATPLPRDRPRALLEVLPDAAGTRVTGRVGVPAWSVIFYTCVAPIFVAIVIVRAVAVPEAPRVLAVVVNVVLAAFYLRTVLACRRALPVLRACVAELVTPTR